MFQGGQRKLHGSMVHFTEFQLGFAAKSFPSSCAICVQVRRALQASKVGARNTRQLWQNQRHQKLRAKTPPDDVYAPHPRHAQRTRHARFFSTRVLPTPTATSLPRHHGRGSTTTMSNPDALSPRSTVDSPAGSSQDTLGCKLHQRHLARCTTLANSGRRSGFVPSSWHVFCCISARCANLTSCRAVALRRFTAPFSL